MTWRNAFGLLSKKNRTYTIVGVITFVILTYIVYTYVLPEPAKAWVYSWVAKPSLGSPGWEAATYKGVHYTAQAFPEGGGMSASEAIDVTSN